MTSTTETPPSTTPADLAWLSTDDGEELVWESGPDRRTLLPVVLVGIPLSIVLIGVVLIAAEYLRVTNTRYVVTDRALYRKTGVLSRDVKRIEHEKVQDISYSQSALGTRFGYGTVEISTAGGAGVEMSFDAVPEPTAVQQLLGEQLERTRGRGERARGRRTEDRPGAGETKDEVLEEILVELRTIRSLLDERDERDERNERSEPADVDEFEGGTEGGGEDRTESKRGTEAGTGTETETDTETETGTQTRYDERSIQ